MSHYVLYWEQTDPSHGCAAESHQNSSQVRTSRYNKTKQVIKATYRFPNMNATIDQMIGHCIDWQVKNHRQQQIKPLVISEGPWWQISLDYLVYYPDGHYNLVTTDQRSRYPEVETVSSTGFKPTKVKLRKTFAHHFTTKQVCADNGPPFKFKEFSDFAQEEGSKSS